MNFDLDLNVTDVDESYTDLGRAEFLRALDNATDVHVTSWEADFLNSTLSLKKFTPKQRKVIDDFAMKYVYVY